MTSAGRTSNRRGLQSREELLDVASRVMAERGYAATSLAVVGREAGFPKSAVTYHFHSKGGLLSEVMARGAYRFFAAMKHAHREGPPSGTPAQRIDWFLQRTGEVFTANPEFLRLHLLLLMSSEAHDAEVDAQIKTVRDDGRAYMNEMITIAFTPSAGASRAREIADALEYFAIACFDGSFVAVQADSSRPISELMTQASAAIGALGEAMAH